MVNNVLFLKKNESLYLPSLVSSSVSSFFSPSEEIELEHIVPIKWCSFEVLQLTKVNVCHQFINHFCLCCFRYWISAYTTPTRKCPWNLTRLTQRAENERGKAGALFRLLQKTMCLIKGTLVLSHSILFLLKHFMKYFFCFCFSATTKVKDMFP